MFLMYCQWIVCIMYFCSKQKLFISDFEFSRCVYMSASIFFVTFVRPASSATVANSICHFSVAAPSSGRCAKPLGKSWYELICNRSVCAARKQRSGSKSPSLHYLGGPVNTTRPHNRGPPSDAQSTRKITAVQLNSETPRCRYSETNIYRRKTDFHHHQNSFITTLTMKQQ